MVVSISEWVSINDWKQDFAGGSKGGWDLVQLDLRLGGWALLLRISPNPLAQKIIIVLIVLTWWVLAAKLPSSDLNYAVDLGADLFFLFIYKERARKKSTKKNLQFSQGNLFEKFPLSNFSRNPFLTFLGLVTETRWVINKNIQWHCSGEN